MRYGARRSFLDLPLSLSRRVESSRGGGVGGVAGLVGWHYWEQEGGMVKDDDGSSFFFLLRLVVGVEVRGTINRVLDMAEKGGGRGRGGGWDEIG